MRAELVNLAESYRKAGDAMHDAIRDSVRKAGGFLSCINNDRSRKDMNVLVYDSKKKYSESFPIRAMRLNPKAKWRYMWGPKEPSTRSVTCETPRWRKSTGCLSRTPTFYSTRLSFPLPRVWRNICNKEQKHTI